ncbi:ester cyclase [Cognatiyoonia sp. IB215446]|uniref:ester cyclase n=1 Tax=Cognatiyoonia sp. IB215446 TaxID=3097355 RepID=UPI002A12970F|nr:ester cyclase [Cognatiyoonia sp. IB215446]MDX8349986.1 ester cyclase [Cognatiyoonia sp. IB215446]
MTIANRLTTTAAALLMTATAVVADNKEKVAVFYDLLSDPGSAELAAAFQDATHESWESIGNYSGENKNREAFLGQMGGFAQLMPDLEWAVQAMHQDGNVITVRSRATGTPVAPLFGVDGEGRSFDILAIDIHELQDGKIARTYHVEDWATALQQLSGE